MSKMILNDWIRGRIPYFRMPPMPNDNNIDNEESSSKINIKQLYNKIFVTSAFSKEDLNVSTQDETNIPNIESNPTSESKTLESDHDSENQEDDWENVFQNVVSTPTVEKETVVEDIVEEEPELSDQESVASEPSVNVEPSNPRKKARMTTNKKKIGVHYYESANVKNKNRNKKRPLNPNEVVKRLQKRKK